MRRTPRSRTRAFDGEERRSPSEARRTGSSRWPWSEAERRPNEVPHHDVDEHGDTERDVVQLVRVPDDVSDERGRVAVMPAIRKLEARRRRDHLGGRIGRGS